jgi:hypothetical protein
MYDRAAIDLRRTFVRFQGAVLVLGLVTTLLALLHQQIGTSTLHWAVIAASIAVGGLITLTGRWATGKRWIVTRGAAESVKSEIFRYRTRTCWYADDRVSDKDGKRRADVLADHLRGIQTRLMHTEASSGLLPPYEEHLPPLVGDASDDGSRQLRPEDYLELRIEDQMRYYQRRLREFARRRTVLRTVAVAASAAGALVAAAGAQIWVALTTAVAAAAIAYMAHLQVDNTIVVYNQSLARLEGLLRSWHQHAGHTPPPHAFDKLVHDTEAVLTAEHWAWVEQMSEAVREDESRQDEVGGTPR